MLFRGTALLRSGKVCELIQPACHTNAALRRVTAPVLSRPQILRRGAMHPFVAAVLLLKPSLDAFRHNSQLQPPDDHPSQPARGRAGQ